ncbi:hypothetical protein TNCT_603481 [Trichonephila clavata]|uniref:Uncharacterized protein n=1 Tax=Trichonephila clavata TaxID=2740835 RepID=A0A8X6IHS5_TRICU|nr:hypothetical protein TNCT_603481 [Trichonephila clavata]
MSFADDTTPHKEWMSDETKSQKESMEIRRQNTGPRTHSVPNIQRSHTKKSIADDTKSHKESIEVRRQNTGPRTHSVSNFLAR